MRYTWAEKFDMYNTYLENNRNAAAALRHYRRKFPNRRQPSKLIFKRTAEKFRNTRNFINTKRNVQAPVLTEDMELTILLHFEENHYSSTRNCARIHEISQGSVVKTLKKYKRKPFSVMPVQKLLPADPALRLQYCQQIIDRHEHEAIFENILWTDEASFTTAGCFNRKNMHYWSSENPHRYKEIQCQGRRSLHVWCGIINNRIVGPLFFEENLNGNRYLGFLRNEIENFLDDLPLEIRRTIIWQQDGAPCHNTLDVRNYLNEKYREWIGKHGTIRWPPRSPDLTPLDTFLWSYLKNKIYAEENLTLDIIRERIIAEINYLNQERQILNDVIQNLLKRYQLCIAQNGGHIENLL